MDIAKQAKHLMRCCLTLISPRLCTNVLYAMKFKKPLDLNHPVTLNDKVLWLRFNTYYNNEAVRQCADKYRVREYIAQKGCSQLLPKLLGHYTSVSQIDWDALPQQFALKLNIGAGCNLIVTDKSKLDIPATNALLAKWLKSKYWLDYAELQYKDVTPCLIAEEYLGTPDGTCPDDYKFYCMNGKPCYVMLCQSRIETQEFVQKPKFYYFDREWNLQPFTRDALANPDVVVPKPEGIDQAFAYAETLAADFPFVRVDLYIIGGKVYFGEMTFTPSAGLDGSRLPATDKLLGDKLELPL